MDNYGIYQDIAMRTEGDIYIGVVGPVRTGKSTFIKKFMETLVLPNIDNNFKRDRARDELPQSSAGRTIMTTEPKFIPNEAIDVVLEDNASFKVRMIDCVGYIIPSALGYIEDDIPRMVTTPWFSQEIPFNMAAEIGTRKVIQEHSTIGLMVTTDGTIGEIPRADYEEAEERVIKELKAIDKPFIILLNSTNPMHESTQMLCSDLEKKYEVPVMAVNCLELDEPQIKKVIETILFEFPIQEIAFDLPSWVDKLENGHWLKTSLIDSIMANAGGISRIRQVPGSVNSMSSNDNIASVAIVKMDLGSGRILVAIRVIDGLFYKILGESTGMNIKDEGELISQMIELSKMKKEYDKVAYALNEVRNKGYGIVNPTLEELSLEEPEIVKHGGRYGVRLKASAPSIHMIRADIETEVSPIVGSEKQSEELVMYLLQEFEESPQKIWASNIFGKSLHELVNEGLHNKLSRMPEDAQSKIQETLQKIINEGSGGLICIIL